MAERPRFIDDLAGVAGGAISALSGVREEIESIVRARVEEIIRRLDLVRRDELEAVQELAANARTAQEEAEARLQALQARVDALESQVAQLRATVQRLCSELGLEPAPLSPPGQD